MLRKIIRIDEEKCNGCGACARACHEGAIAMVDGKARLMREDYCDGLGDCLPACPAGAISFETREAAAYDEAAVRAAKAAAPHACPGSRPTAFARAARPTGADSVPSQLSQCPASPVRPSPPGTRPDRPSWSSYRRGKPRSGRR